MYMEISSPSQNEGPTANDQLLERKTVLGVAFVMFALFLAGVTITRSESAPMERNAALQTTKSFAQTNDAYKPMSSGDVVLSPDSTTGMNINEDIAHGLDVGSTTQFPFAVLLLIGDSYCSGTIISESFVQTAAHCVYNKPISSITVNAGFIRWNTDPSTKQVRQVKAAHIYPGYPGNGRDFAIIEVSSPFTLNAHVNIVPLVNAMNAHVDGLAVTAVGWGQTSPGTHSDGLKYATMNVVSEAKCGANIKSSSEICATGGTGSTCGGDSGGPLLYNYHGKWTLVGSNSWSPTYPGCDAAANFDVFDSFQTYWTWMYQKIYKLPHPVLLQSHKCYKDVYCNANDQCHGTNVAC